MKKKREKKQHDKKKVTVLVHFAYTGMEKARVTLHVCAENDTPGISVFYFT